MEAGEMDRSDNQRQSRSGMTTLHGDHSDGSLFGEIRERRVTFCIDTSGSMYDCLDAVKDQLIATLQKCSGDAFNVIEFSSSVVQWANELVSRTDATVSAAVKWIRDLRPKTGANTGDAVVAALSDPTCEAVYLVTDSVPDEPADDVVDSVLRAAGKRPVHCRYIQRHTVDLATLAFLRDIATETFGSLLAVTVSTQGRILDVLPIYRSEMTPERLVRTTSGDIVPSAYKMCSIGTRLDGPPPAATMTTVVSPTVLPWPYSLYPWPYRYYHSILDVPAMRWRPGKAWMKHTRELSDRIISASVPGAGAMLVGQQVLARRHRDGFFYVGTVKSQILDNQFLVEFGPCKHGKFAETEYQETFVYDIVSHCDALRHPIMLDDNVLAPWEPEGERYAPAVVISGLEKRMADGGGEDEQIIATFHNGKTVSVPKDKAMWIPRDLYERAVFEIGLPKNVRQEFATQDFYPYYTTSFGYPTSGPLAYPAQFDQFVPRGYVGSGCGRSSVGWGSRSCRGQPWMMARSQSASVISGHRQPTEDALKDGDREELIPGTELTKSQLNSKVMAQIIQSKLGEDRHCGSDDGRLLKKRAAANDTAAGVLKKSVSFADLKDADCDLSDSGHGSQVDLSLSDVEEDGRAQSEGIQTTSRDSAVGMRTSWRTPRRPRTSSPQRRAWRYWNTDPSPSLLEPRHYGPYREGPYRDCMDSLSLLQLRDAKKNDYNTVEWTSPVPQVVDSYACYKYSPGVKDCLGYVRGAPLYKSLKQGHDRDLREVVGSRQLTAEQLAEARRAYRQRQTLAREIGWQRRAADADEAQQTALDTRRQRVNAQLDRERARSDEQRLDAERRLAARRQLHDQLLTRFRDNADEFGERQARRIAARTEQRINRNIEANERAAQAAEKQARHQAARELRNMARIEAHMARVSEQEQQAAAQHQQNVRNQAFRHRNIRQRDEAERVKQQAADMAEHQRIVWRAQVLP